MLFYNLNFLACSHKTRLNETKTQVQGSCFHVGPHSEGNALFCDPEAQSISPFNMSPTGFHRSCEFPRLSPPVQCDHLQGRVHVLPLCISPQSANKKKKHVSRWPHKNHCLWNWKGQSEAMTSWCGKGRLAPLPHFVTTLWSPPSSRAPWGGGCGHSCMHMGISFSLCQPNLLHSLMGASPK